jgi:hypothetical protein
MSQNRSPMESLEMYIHGDISHGVLEVDPDIEIVCEMELFYNDDLFVIK